MVLSLPSGSSKLTILATPNPSTSRPEYSLQSASQTPPCIPGVIWRHKDHSRCYSGSFFSCPWRHQYELLPSHLKRIMGPCPSRPQCFQQTHSLTKIRSASDGSVLHAQGFQGWLISKFNNEVLVQIFGATDVRIEDVSSYRAEICGNIATFTILTLIRKTYGFPPSHTRCM
jgi:hypothetical protein